MDQQKVAFRTEGGVATITLNRPDVRNALSPDMLDELAAAVERCRGKEVRAVVITGSGGAFCSGADISDLAQTLERSADDLASHLKGLADRLHHDVVLKIRQLAKPVVASISGVAAGAGFSLALACDLRIASQEARFFLAYANIGATADGGSTFYLPRLLGPSRAMEVYLMNQPISAQRAFDIGLVNRVVPGEELQQHTLEMAQRLAAGPTLAYGRVKALMDRSWSSDLASQLDDEATAIGEIALSRDFQEGITAFVEKRGPRFEGK